MAISKHTTIHQIAALANVSTATASRVINRPESVKSETRNRVLLAMRELNYQAKQHDSRYILAVFPNFANPFYGSCIDGMQDAAKKRNYHLLLQQMEYPHNPDSYDFLLNNTSFHGVIFNHPLPDNKLLESIRLKQPVVMCSQYNPVENVPHVIIDDYMAAKNAMAYLISIGKRRIAMINALLNYSYAQYREHGYLDAMKEAGLEIRPNWIAHINDVDFGVAVSFATTLLSETERPDAVFCVSDVFASAVIKAAGQLGLSVPGDVAVMGFDNVDLCNMTVPTISTVSQPTYQLGWQSCSLLIDQLEGVPILSNRIVLDTELVIRSST